MATTQPLPFMAFRFRVRFDEGESLGGFTECSGLNLETRFHEQEEGGANDHVHRLPTRTIQPNVTLKKGITDRKIWDWYYEMVQGNPQQKNVTIEVLDTEGKEVVMSFVLQRALPCKWNGPELNATQTQFASETLELCHQGLKRSK